MNAVAMKKNKLLISIIFLVVFINSFSFSAQTIGHIWSGKIAWNLADDYTQREMPWANTIAKPMAAFSSHMVMDKAIGEAQLGEWQVYIGIVRAFVGYFVTKENERDEYVQYSFWALLPDIGQKWLGWNWIHPEIPGDKIFNLNRDQNELLEELALSSLIFKWEVKF